MSNCSAAITQIPDSLISSVIHSAIAMSPITLWKPAMKRSYLNLPNKMFDRAEFIYEQLREKKARSLHIPFTIILPNVSKMHEAYKYLRKHTDYLIHRADSSLTSLAATVELITPEDPEVDISSEEKELISMKNFINNSLLCDIFITNLELYLSWLAYVEPKFGTPKLGHLVMNWDMDKEVANRRFMKLLNHFSFDTKILVLNNKIPLPILQQFTNQRLAIVNYSNEHN